MSNTLSKILMVAAGAAIGSVVTWRLLDAKYAQRAEKEIEEIKAYYADKHSQSEGTEPSAEGQESVDEIERVKVEYSTLTKKYKSEEGGSESMDTIGTDPYVIHPDDFDTMDDYDTVNLTHYTDGVLADDDDNIVEDIANTVGVDYASHFGEYEDDSVYVRNERLKTDYEILMDYRPYYDVVDSTPNGEE